MNITIQVNLGNKFTSQDRFLLWHLYPKNNSTFTSTYFRTSFHHGYVKSDTDMSRSETESVSDDDVQGLWFDYVDKIVSVEKDLENNTSCQFPVRKSNVSMSICYRIRNSCWWDNHTNLSYHTSSRIYSYEKRWEQLGCITGWKSFDGSQT